MRPSPHAGDNHLPTYSKRAVSLHLGHRRELPHISTCPSKPTRNHSVLYTPLWGGARLRVGCERRMGDCVREKSNEEVLRGLLCDLRVLHQLARIPPHHTGCSTADVVGALGLGTHSSKATLNASLE